MAPANEKATDRYQARREAMLEIAARYFLDHGYAGTTMSAIAAAVGGSKATLWNYFPSKEKLFAAVIDLETTAFRAELSTILDPCATLEDTLRLFCVRLMRKITSPDAIRLHRLVVAEAGRFPEMGEIFFRRAPLPTIELLSGYLQQWMDNGGLRRDDPMLAARQLLGLCMTGLHQMMLMGLADEASDEEIDAHVDATLRAFLDGYRAR